jgi:hypothetical protein
MRSRLLLLLLLPTALGLAGCDMLGIESATVMAEKRSAEGKAVGAACRHAGRAIEDCYTLNKKADKAAIYAGWREMDDYMRENKLEPVLPVIKPEAPKPKPPADGEETADAAHGSEGTAKPAADKPAKSAH